MCSWLRLGGLQQSLTCATTPYLTLWLHKSKIDPIKGKLNSSTRLDLRDAQRVCLRQSRNVFLCVVVVSRFEHVYMKDKLYIRHKHKFYPPAWALSNSATFCFCWACLILNFASSPTAASPSSFPQMGHNQHIYSRGSSLVSSLLLRQASPRRDNSSHATCKRKIADHSILDVRIDTSHHLKLIYDQSHYPLTTGLSDQMNIDYWKKDVGDSSKRVASADPVFSSDCEDLATQHYHDEDSSSRDRFAVGRYGWRSARMWVCDKRAGPS